MDSSRKSNKEALRMLWIKLGQVIMDNKSLSIQNLRAATGYDLKAKLQQKWLLSSLKVI